jgi:hypothetical protein
MKSPTITPCEALRVATAGLALVMAVIVKPVPYVLAIATCVPVAKVIAMVMLLVQKISPALVAWV